MPIQSKWRWQKVAPVLFILVAVGLGTVFGIRISRQIRVTYILEQAGTLGTTERLTAQNALRQMGTKAVPILLDRIRHEHSLVQRWYRALWPNMPAGLQRRFARPTPPLTHGNPRTEIVSALEVLDSSVVPCLIAALQDRNSDVQVTVDWFGPTDFLQMNAEWPAFCPPYDFDAAGSYTSLFVGAPIQTVPDLVERANPITYVTPDDPPMLIAHGLADCVVPVAQSQILYDALHAAGVRTTLNLVPNAGHGDINFILAQASVAIDYLDQQLHAL